VVRIGEPLWPAAEEGRDKLAVALDLATRMNACIEAAIRAAPSQWTFWPSLPSRWAYADIDESPVLAPAV
jgi:predicted secreted protein